MPLTIAAYNRKGGVGKSTFIYNAGWALTHSRDIRKRVLVIDSDGQGDTSRLLSGANSVRDIRPPTLLDVYAGQPVDVAIRPSAFQPSINSEEPQFMVLPASRDLDVLELQNRLADPWTLHSILEGQASDYDFVLIDLPGHLGQLSMNGILAADLLVIPVDLQDRSGVVNLRDVLEAMAMIRNQASTRDIQVFFLFNRQDRRVINEPHAHEVRAIAKREGVGVLTNRIHQNVSIQKALTAGMPVGEFDHRSTGARDYRGLAHELVDLAEEMANE